MRQLLQVIMLAALLLPGCRTSGNAVGQLPVVSEPPVPLYATLMAIRREPYVLDWNDCSNKAAKYTLRLTDAGYQANMLVLTLEVDSEPRLHAIVQIVMNGSALYADPTNGHWAYAIDGLSFPGYRYKPQPLYLLTPRDVRRRHADPEYRVHP